MSIEEPNPPWAVDQLLNDTGYDMRVYERLDDENKKRLRALADEYHSAATHLDKNQIKRKVEALFDVLGETT